MNITEYIAIGVTAFLALVGTFGFGWVRILRETNELLKDQNVELKKAHEVLLEKYTTNQQEINIMKGQIKELKSIPLVNIDVTLKQLAQFNQTLSVSNEKILQSLEVSSKRLIEHDKQLLERSELVKEQLAEDTKIASDATKKVKSNLEENGGV